LTLGASWLLARVTEARTADVRHTIYRVLDRARRRQGDYVSRKPSSAVPQLP
jgi:hypothetical protein